MGCSKSAIKDRSTEGFSPVKDTGRAVESSSFVFKGTEYLAYNPLTNELVFIKNLSTGKILSLPFHARFFYFLNHQETLYVFYQENNSIYFRTTEDMISYSAPTLSLSPDSSIYNQLWNVAVQVDSQGQWHLLVECSDSTPNQQAVGLSYMVSSGPVFESEKTHFMDIPGGGNPELKILPQGMIAIHGQLTAGFWEIAYSVHNYAWSTPKTLIQKDFIHLADPNVTETANGLWISFSFDQVALYAVDIDTTYLDLFNN